MTLPTIKPVQVPAIVHELCTFTAACPRCGWDTEWVETRNDTRVRVVITGCCGGDA